MLNDVHWCLIGFNNVLIISNAFLCFSIIYTGFNSFPMLFHRFQTIVNDVPCFRVSAPLADARFVFVFGWPSWITRGGPPMNDDGDCLFGCVGEVGFAGLASEEAYWWDYIDGIVIMYFLFLWQSRPSSIHMMVYMYILLHTLMHVHNIMHIHDVCVCVCMQWVGFNAENPNGRCQVKGIHTGNKKGRNTKNKEDIKDKYVLLASPQTSR